MGYFMSFRNYTVLRTVLDFFGSDVTDALQKYLRDATRLPTGHFVWKSRKAVTTLFGNVIPGRKTIIRS